jgi:class 3 adenylate cyclase
MKEPYRNKINTPSTPKQLPPSVKRSLPESLEKLLRARNEIDEIIRKTFKQKVTVMFTDIVGSTRYFQEKRDIEGRAMIQRHNDLLFPIIEGHAGKIIKTIGDAIMACFDEEDMAIAASLKMHQALVEYNRDREKNEEIHIRIGIHSGVVISEERDLFGNVVNLAARIESLAGGDQILTSETTYRNADKQIFNFCSHGPFSLEGIKDEIAVYEVLWYEGQESRAPQKGVTVSAAIPLYRKSNQDNLPLKTYRDLIGRDIKMGEVMTALRDPGGKWVITIDGMGGIGKTALAREVADHCLRERLFEDCIWESAKEKVFVQERIQKREFPGVTFESLLDSIARQLGLLDVLKLKDKDKETAIKTILTSRRVLIVMDNLETIEGYESLVDRLLNLLNPGKLLITTRHKLKSDYVYSISLTGLVEDDGLIFLRKEAQERNIQQVASATTPSLKKIYQKTGGAPLAMKLVVGQLARLSLKDVLDNLEKVKVGGEYEDFYRFIYWPSWQLLSSETKKILISMSHFASIGGDKEAILAVSDIDIESVNKGIDELWIMSLIEVGGSVEKRRYALHQLTRYFVLSELVKVWK